MACTYKNQFGALKKKKINFFTYVIVTDIDAGWQHYFHRVKDATLTGWCSQLLLGVYMWHMVWIWAPELLSLLICITNHLKYSSQMLHTLDKNETWSQKGNLIIFCFHSFQLFFNNRSPFPVFSQLHPCALKLYLVLHMAWCHPACGAFPHSWAGR